MHLKIIYEVRTDKKSQLLYGKVGYTVRNYTGNPQNCKSVMDHYFFINDIVIS